MATLVLDKVPEELLSQLEQLAARERLSVAEKTVRLLQEAVGKRKRWDTAGDGAAFPQVGTAEWGEMNRKRAELIRKKIRGELSESEREECETLQRLSLAEVEASFPRQDEANDSHVQEILEGMVRDRFHPDPAGPDVVEMLRKDRNR